MTASLCVEPIMHDEYAFTEEAGHSVDGVEGFDYEALDKLEDRIRQALKEGKSVTGLVAELIEYEANRRACAAISRVVCMIADARKPKLMVKQLAWVTGMGLTEGQSQSALAAQHRIRKQAFSQAAWRLARKLGLKPSRQMRSLKARESMARAYRERHSNGVPTRATAPLPVKENY